MSFDYSILIAIQTVFLADLRATKLQQTHY